MSLKRRTLRSIQVIIGRSAETNGQQNKYHAWLKEEKLKWSETTIELRRMNSRTN
jgi:hypothetical protein